MRRFCRTSVKLVGDAVVILVSMVNAGLKRRVLLDVAENRSLWALPCNSSLGVAVGVKWSVAHLGMLVWCQGCRMLWEALLGRLS